MDTDANECGENLSIPEPKATFLSGHKVSAVSSVALEIAHCYVKRCHLVIHEKAPNILVRTGVVAVAFFSVNVLVEDAGVEPQ
jgi:hypothetical protein